MVEVGQGEALEHPRRRGHPLGKWVEAVAHRSFLPTGRVEKPGRRRRSLMRWRLRWPVGSYVGVERERKLRLKWTRRKGGKGCARGSAHRKGWFHGGASEQRGNSDGRPKKRWGPPMRWPVSSRTSMRCWKRWQLGWKTTNVAWRRGSFWWRFRTITVGSRRATVASDCVMTAALGQ
jgi:hypothetical protein